MQEIPRAVEQLGLCVITTETVLWSPGAITTQGPETSYLVFSKLPDCSRFWPNHRCIARPCSHILSAPWEPTWPLVPCKRAGQPPSHIHLGMTMLANWLHGGRSSFSHQGWEMVFRLEQDAHSPQRQMGVNA